MYITLRALHCIEEAEVSCRFFGASRARLPFALLELLSSPFAFALLRQLCIYSTTFLAPKSNPTQAKPSQPNIRKNAQRRSKTQRELSSLRG